MLGAAVDLPGPAGADVAALGGDQHAVAAALERLRDQPLVVADLVLAGAVGVGRVDQVDAGVERRVDDADPLRLVGAAGERERHRAEPDREYLGVRQTATGGLRGRHVLNSSILTGFTPSAHPYRDLGVIDARGPRTNQAVIGTLSLVALLTGAWWIAPLLALQLLLGLTLGRRWCLPCLAYFELIQPRFGEGPLEDSRPPRFANKIGAGCLTGATVFFLAGLPVAGWLLTGLVAALALLAAVTGFCTGCWVHKLIYGECEACDVPAPRPGLVARRADLLGVDVVAQTLVGRLAQRPGVRDLGVVDHAHEAGLDEARELRRLAPRERGCRRARAAPAACRGAPARPG